MGQSWTPDKFWANSGTLKNRNGQKSSRTSVTTCSKLKKNVLEYGVGSKFFRGLIRPTLSYNFIKYRNPQK